MHPVTEALGVCAASCGTSCQSLSSGLTSFTQSSLCWVESALSCSSYRTFIANNIYAWDFFSSLEMKTEEEQTEGVCVMTF